MDDTFLLIFVFVIAALLGFELITKVPPTLHTPLMSGSNAISGITIVGAIIASSGDGFLNQAVAFLAITLAMMLKMVSACARAAGRSPWQSNLGLAALSLTKT